MSYRSDVLADRLLQGANGLAELAATLTTEEWRTPIEGGGLTIGTVVLHTASAYPVEIERALALARGESDQAAPVVGTQAGDRAADREDAVALLRQQSAAAARRVRMLRSSALDSVAPAAIYGGAPVSCQFLLEDRTVRHSFHHAAKIKAALGR